MDWMLTSGGAPSLVFIPLGTFYNNHYYTSRKCLFYLEELIKQLNYDDAKTHARRRGLGFVDIVNRDLKPILISCNQDKPKIYRSAVRLLVEVTTPIQYLVFENVNASDQRGRSPHILYDLKQLLYSAKESFLDPLATRVLIDHPRRLLENQPLAFDDIEIINISLLLIRNILCAPERPSHSTRDYWQQNQLVWNLYAQGLDHLLMALLACPQKDRWVVAIAQVIAVIYQDRPLRQLKNRLGTIMNSSIASESSEDNDESSSTSSDSIDLFDTIQHITFPLNPMSVSRMNRSFTRTLTGNSIAVYQNPSEKSIKRHVKDENLPLKKKRRRMGFQYKPIKDDILKILLEFIVDFMMEGYNILVGNLYQMLLQQMDQQFDTTELVWLIGFFLDFAPILKLDMKSIKDVFNIDMLCFLTWETTLAAEKVESNSFKRLARGLAEVSPCQKRLSHCVWAIREFMQVVYKYSRFKISTPTRESESLRGDEQWSYNLCSYLPAMRDLRQLFLLLLRQFNAKFQSRRYLRDIIAGNHLLLVTLMRADEISTYASQFDLNQHLSQFCSKSILAQYGTALRNFRTNGTFINDSIFTVLLHCAYDLDRVDLLCEPYILYQFAKIVKTKFKICSEWHNLIAFILRKCLRDNHRKCFNFRSRHRSEGSRSPSTLKFKLTQFYVQTAPVASSNNPFFRGSSFTDIPTLIAVIGQLKNFGFQKQLDWIQSSLLKFCSAKLGTYSGREFYNPVACFSLKINVPCPVIPWTEVEASAMHSDLFFSFLHRLGLLPSTSSAGVYPCIPREWTIDILFRVALIFGPINQQMVDFNLSLVTSTPVQGIDGNPILNQSTDWYSHEKTWEAFLETEPSSSMPGVSQRVLRWVEQSGVGEWTPEKEMEYAIILPQAKIRGN